MWSGGAAVGTGNAAATTVNWNCGVLEVGRWCLYNVRHSYYSAIAYYYQSRQYVCAKVIRDSDGSDYAQACADYQAELSVCGCLLLKPLVYNGGPYRHTINGSAGY